MADFIKTILTIAATAASFITLFLFYEDSWNKLLLKVQSGVPKGFLIFISGTNGVGKSTIAEKVANKLGITSVVEVDDLRESLRSQYDLFLDANRKNEYEILSVSSYLSDNIQIINNSNEIGNYVNQCTLMTRPIMAVALSNR